MSRIDELIEELCPQGVEFRSMSSIGTFIRGQRFVKEDMRSEGLPCIHYGEVYTKYQLEASTAFSFLEPAQATRLRKAQPGDVVIAAAGETIEDIGKPVVWRGNGDVVIHDALYVFKSPLDPKFVAYFLRTDDFKTQARRLISSSKISAISIANFGKINIPNPPLQVQREIVSILDKFTQLEAELEAELEARRIQYEVTRDRLLDFSGDLEGHPLGTRIPMECLETLRSIRLGNLVKTQTPAGKIPRSKFLEDGLFPIVDQSQALIAGFTDDESLVNDFEPCVVFGDHTREIKYVDFPFAAGADGTVILLPTWELSAKFLFYSLQTLRIQSRGYNRHWSVVKELEISIPSLELQREIVPILDKLDALVNDITIGLPAEIAARRKQYEYYRNKLLTFKEVEAA